MVRATFILCLSILLATCPCLAGQEHDAQPSLKDQIKKTLRENPDLIFEAFKGHEEKLYDLLQIGLEKKNKSRIRAGRIKQLENPKKTPLHPHRPVWGPADSDISIIVFSDFQSATCSKADKIILQLLQKHPEINYRFRHNPLGIYKMSKTAALYYEALALQDHTKAINFNHLIFKNRLKIKKDGQKELDRLAAQCGADLDRLHNDIKSSQVKNIVDNDIREAKKLGFTASPVFLVNGVTVTGAAPLDEFEEVFKIVRSID